ncbi:MAG TPA: ATP-binding protein [Candidatus Desulfaltia sp.]|nr:ATP-binding protein [Candidatus Desulfaltia sp.]
MDDEEDKLLKVFLQETDPSLQVDSVNSAKKALRLLGTREYDCVVCDYQMPEVTGIQFARQLKKSKDLPFIIYTGQGSEEVAQAAFAAGVDDYVRKEVFPSHYTVLANSIRQAVEKRRAEHELRESLETSSLVFEHMPSGVFLYRHEEPDRLVLTNCNPEALRQTNLTRDAIIGKEFNEIWGPKGDALKQEYLKAITEGRQVKYERLLWDDQKVSGFFRLSALPLPGERFVVAFENISDKVGLKENAKAQESRKPASLVFSTDEPEEGHVKALPESEDWFSNIYYESPIGIEIYDRDGALIDANPAALSYFGVDKVEDYRGWNIFRDSSLTDEQKESLRKGTEVSVEIQRDFDRVKYKTRKRGVHYFETTFKAVSTGGEEHRAGYMGLIRDVTDIKRSEAQVREYTEQLEKTILERSSELLEAERMATAGRVASMVGHDLRSPLQSVKNAVYMIRQRPEYTGRMLDVIEGAVDRSLKMLDELRQRTREEPLVLELTDMKALVEQVAREAPHPPKITIVVEAEGVALIHADPLRVRRTLENLINNAIESIHVEGEVKVTLRREEDAIVLRVSDQGRGISPEVISQLFKPFFTTKPGGMGLGLAFCKRTVEAHGGTIKVESEEGKGTTATITLPVNKQPQL